MFRDESVVMGVGSNELGQDFTNCSFALLRIYSLRFSVEHVMYCNTLCRGLHKPVV